MSLLVIEGLDGSGKGTQIALLYDALTGEGRDVLRLTFPDYASPSSSLVKMYLGGEFGARPEDVNPYAACSFYAVDRFASYTKSWKSELQADKMILADRYTTSNIVYQMTKLPEAQWAEFIAWVEDMEYQRLGLPRPNRVIYLDMPPEVSQKLLTKRYQGDNSKKDIHESNVGFLQACRKSASFAAKRLGWTVIGCSENGDPRPIEAIAADVLRAAKEIIN